jgi:hypothetical protein
MSRSRLNVAMLTIVAAMLFVIGHPFIPTAAAQEAQTFHESGYTALATFTSTNGCTTTTVPIYLRDGSLHMSGEARQGPFMDLDSLTIIDDCTGETLLSAYFSSETFAFDVAPQLASATLEASNLAAQDCYGSLCASLAGPLDVSITWTATGDLYTSSTQLHENLYGDRRNVQGKATIRPVTASGTITDGATNFTPSPAADAWLSFDTYTWVNAPAAP